MSSHRGLAERLASFAAATQYSDLPSEIVGLIKLHVLDTLGVALGASRTSSWPMMLDIVTAEGGYEESTLFGAGIRVPAASAALFNGSLTHALGFDDTHLEALLHPFGAIVPTVLAVAERDQLDGSSVIRAVAVGAEVTCRLGIAAGRALVQSAFQPTAVCGSFGAVAAVGAARGLDEATIANALGLAASMAGGLHESTLDGTWTKQVHAGLAAHVGMVAVEFAEAGLTASAGMLDGDGGLLHAYGRGQIDFSRMDWIVREAAKRGVYTIFDLHVWPGQRQAYDRIGRPEGEGARQAMAQLWTEVAAHYRGNGAIAALDLINEFPGAWGVQQVLSRAVQAGDPNRVQVVEGFTYAEFLKLHAAGTFPNSVFSDHFYRPEPHASEAPRAGRAG